MNCRSSGSACVKLLECEPNVHVTGEAGDAIEILDLVRRFNPDILLLSVSLGARSGLEILRELSVAAERVRTILLALFRAPFLDASEATCRLAGMPEDENCEQPQRARSRWRVFPEEPGPRALPTGAEVGVKPARSLVTQRPARP